MDLHPPIEPHRSGTLDVGDGHALYWEISGDPTGTPVLFLHGGPGAGTAPTYRRFFNPAHWRAVLFDQRGCGRSSPNSCIEANTTADLVADIERLRMHLDIERWLVFGGSWGSTLALAYGQAHPERVSGFVLRGVFLFRPHEVDWFLHGMGRFFPEAWQNFAGHVDFAPDLLEAYHRLLTNPDPDTALTAARVWCRYEESCARLLPRLHTSDMDPAACLAMARLECHYMMNSGFLPENGLLAAIDRIQHLPCTIVQGRYDVVCPPETAADLARAWTGARLVMVPDAGHSSMEPSLRTALVAAVDDMKERVR